VVVGQIVTQTIKPPAPLAYDGMPHHTDAFIFGITDGFTDPSVTTGNLHHRDW
jgi:hypothetical protein